MDTTHLCRPQRIIGHETEKTSFLAYISQFPVDHRHHPGDFSSIYSARAMRENFLAQTADDLKVRALLLQRQATLRLLINDEAAVNELSR